jgi:hypothetical protein
VTAVASDVSSSPHPGFSESCVNKKGRRVSQKHRKNVQRMKTRAKERKAAGKQK